MGGSGVSVVFSFCSHLLPFVPSISTFSHSLVTAVKRWGLVVMHGYPGIASRTAGITLRQGFLGFIPFLGFFSSLQQW